MPGVGPSGGRRAGPHRRPPRRAQRRPDPRGTAGRRTGGGRPVNKQVAAQLYVSVYTVEAHLSQAYAKLGIASRSQLAAALAPGG